MMKKKDGGGRKKGKYFSIRAMYMKGRKMVLDFYTCE